MAKEQAFVFIVDDDDAVRESLEFLISAFAPLGGLVKAPADRRLIAVTVPAAAGFPAVEAAMGTWAAGVSVQVEWGFTNVFGPNGEPLNWWQEF